MFSSVSRHDNGFRTAALVKTIVLDQIASFCFSVFAAFTKELLDIRHKTKHVLNQNARFKHPSRTVCTSAQKRGAPCKAPLVCHSHARAYSSSRVVI